ACRPLRLAKADEVVVPDEEVVHESRVRAPHFPPHRHEGRGTQLPPVRKRGAHELRIQQVGGRRGYQPVILDGVAVLEGGGEPAFLGGEDGKRLVRECAPAGGHRIERAVKRQRLGAPGGGPAGKGEEQEDSSLHREEKLTAGKSKGDRYSRSSRMVGVMVWRFRSRMISSLSSSPGP